MKRKALLLLMIGAVTASLLLSGCQPLPQPVKATPVIIPDSDQDGVNDQLDLCPDTAAGIKVTPAGCPMVIDSDHDGIPDHQDACPATPARTTVDAQGCPVVIDSDHDGIPDHQDTCPATPAKTAVDVKGCPLLPPDMIDWTDPAMTFNVEYLPNETIVNAKFSAEMEKLAKYINANPDRRFIIEGHTDSVGSETENMKLSLKRAEEVKAYLSGKMGIAADLLEVRGFGEMNPVAENNTQEGRKQNRRVVILAIPK